MATQTRDAAIVGIYEYPLRKAPGVTPLQIKAESAAKALARRSAKQTAEIYEEIRAAIDTIGKRDKYDLIVKVESPQLESSERLPAISQMIYHRPILYHDDALDLTDEVLQLLDEAWAKKKKAGGGGKKNGK